MNNSEWGSRLRSQYIARNSGSKIRNIRVPDEGELRLRGNSEQLTISIGNAAASESNMQTSAGAFDGWLFAIRHWCNVRKFHIELQDGAQLTGTHGGRTQFRLRKLAELLGQEISFGETLKSEMTKHAWQPGLGVWLNVAGSMHGPKTAPYTLVKESDLEIALCYDADLSGQLVEKFGLIRRPHAKYADAMPALCRQFPVGVFSKDPAKTRKYDIICPKGKSAIDLVGVDIKQAFHIFELKKPNAISVGALSELLFYANLMHEARKGGAISFSAGKSDPEARVHGNDVHASTAIRAHLLVPDRHPLLPDDFFAEITSLAQKANWEFSIDAFDLRETIPAITSRLPAKRAAA